MAEIQVQLPDSRNDFIQAQLEAGRYAHAGDYLRDFVKRTGTSRRFSAD